MGWFAVATVIGFLLLRSVRHHASTSKTGHGLADEAQPLAPFIIRFSERTVRFIHKASIEALPWSLLVVASVVCVFIVLSAKFEPIHAHLAEIVDSIERGAIARILFGLILGFGIAFATQQASSTPPNERKNVEPPAGSSASAPPDGEGNDVGNNQTITKSGQELQTTNSGARIGVSSLLLAGSVITILALTAPYLDNWLRHLSSIKLPYAELQITTNSAAKGVKADSLIYLADTFSLAGLRTYSDKIRKDIQYIELLEIPELSTEIEVIKTVSNHKHAHDAAVLQREIEKKQQFINDAKKVLPVFDVLISPMAKCIEDAIHRGLSVETLRQSLRPLADRLEQIIFPEEDPSITDELRDEFWKDVKDIPNRGEIRHFTFDKKIKTLQHECIKRDMEYPTLSDAKAVPYLYVAAVLMAAFMKYDDLTEKIIEFSINSVKVKDYELLYYAAYLGYYYNNSSLTTVLKYLQELRMTAAKHRETIEKARVRCAGHLCDRRRLRLIDDLYKREQAAEHRAINDIAYYIADNLARGVGAAERYRHLAEEYANTLYLLINSDKLSNSDEYVKYEFLDTYAYVNIALESRMRTPDSEKIRKMRDHLERVISYFEAAESRGEILDKTDQYNLALARSHLASARELIE